jgi:hypothetical protein
MKLSSFAGPAVVGCAAVVLVLFGVGKWMELNYGAILSPSYTDMVAKYGTQRIQFDMRCQAVPVNGVYKNGSSVMFDNRSGDARIITFNGKQYNVPGYGWAIVNLSARNLPVSWPIDCGAARNVSKINIQQ